MISSLWGWFVSVAYIVFAIFVFPPMLILPAVIVVVAVVIALLTAREPEGVEMTQVQRTVLVELLKMGFRESEVTPLLTKSTETNPKLLREMVVRNVLNGRRS